MNTYKVNMKLIPMNNQLVVEPIEPVHTISGVLLLNQKYKHAQYKVISVSSHIKSSEIEVGDTIFADEIFANKVELGDHVFHLLDYNRILGVIC